MTTAVELDRYRMPLPGPGTPVIPEDRVVALHAHLNTHYSAAKWPLAPLIDNPATSLRVIEWSKCPVSLREEMRLVTWTLLNGELRPTFVKERRSRRSRLGPDATWQAVQEWFRMAGWLGERGIRSLAECDAAVLHDYGVKVRDSGVSRSRVVKLLGFVTRMWAFDQLSARPTGIERPPWDETGIDDYLPSEKGGGGENSREPLATQTMGPLLIWAMRTVDDFADDILAAWEEARRLAEAARTTAATTAGRAALHAYLVPIIEDGAPVPASWNRGELCFARSYVGGLTGASERQVDTAIKRYGLTKAAGMRPGACPLDRPVTGRIAGVPWRTAIDFSEAASLMRNLGTASFIVCAYLTGMRPEEVLGMRSGCCPDPQPDEDGNVGRHLIRSVHYKTVTDGEGNYLAGGTEREVPWVAITPVVNAIRVLERMVPAGHLLFDHDAHDALYGLRPSTRGALRAQGMRQRIEDFATWANTEAEAQGLPAEVIPPDPHGNIGTARFRRSLAWHIARRPGGLVALAIQYGHIRTALNTDVSGGYGTRSRGGIHDVLALETALATAETAADLHEQFETGGGISGPSARRALVEAATSRRFEGREIKTDFARKYAAAQRYLARDGAVLYDNPNALLLCLYKQDRALCQRDGVGAEAPTLDRCVPGCGNTVRTDEHAARLRERAEHIDKQAAHTPQPIGDRLRANADKLRSFADEHDETRFTRQETPA
ncbi:integrase [Streptomyces sp. H10-C2]|uniref:integrase n=1 Tax=unclassified Streptomyces TaxID=2593676 RepID=UPI0024B9A323|nr:MULTISPECIES: integrase [unclassified Streptomyces]MDJ0341766.1 integrase [Streptomyces sp. PH10-H1]MDJ0368926.1 integrase [Streptomyces sp. H10-C2]